MGKKEMRHDLISNFDNVAVPGREGGSFLFRSSSYSSCRDIGQWASFFFFQKLLGEGTGRYRPWTGSGILLFAF